MFDGVDCEVLETDEEHGGRYSLWEIPVGGRRIYLLRTVEQVNKIRKVALRLKVYSERYELLVLHEDNRMCGVLVTRKADRRYEPLGFRDSKYEVEEIEFGCARTYFVSGENEVNRIKSVLNNRKLRYGEHYVSSVIRDDDGEVVCLEVKRVEDGYCRGVNYSFGEIPVGGSRSYAIVDAAEAHRIRVALVYYQEGVGGRYKTNLVCRDVGGEAMFLTIWRVE